MPKIVFKKEQIESTRKVVDEGMYWVTLTGFAQKNARIKEGQAASESINFNPILELTALEDGSPAPTRDDGKPITLFYSANTKFVPGLNDFVHAFGLPMEEDGNGGISLPGIWVPEAEEDIEKCEYKGPLVGRKAKVYLVRGEYNGNPKNEIKYFVCAVDNCHQKYPRIKHSANLIRN